MNAFLMRGLESGWIDVGMLVAGGGLHPTYLGAGRVHARVWMRRVRKGGVAVVALVLHLRGREKKMRDAKV